MKNKMICLDISLETVGPVFVGSGLEYKKSEYILNTFEKMCYIMDTLKMFRGLKALHLLNEYEKWVLSEQKYLNLFKFARDNNIRSSEYKKWAKYSFPVSNAADLRDANISPFIKDPYDLPYIPGSSLKGALRNAVLNSELLDSDDTEDIADKAERSAGDFKKRKFYLAAESSELDIKLFHTLGRVDAKGREVWASNAVNSVFQGLRISDSRPVPAEALGLFQKIDVSDNGKTNALPILRECIKPGVRIGFTAEIDPDIFPYSPEDIIRCINNMYKNEQEKFMSFFPEMPVYSGNMIYIGGGSGFITKTAVYSLFRDRKRAVKNTSVILDNTDLSNKGRKVGNHLSDNKVSPHMRKITVSNGNKYEFGLCRISISEREI